MTSGSSFFSRISLSRDGSPVLPLHSTANSRRPIRHKPSEYDLDQLSPKPEEPLLDPDAEPAFSFATAPETAKSVSMRPQYNSPRASPSRHKHASWAPPSPVVRAETRVLFAGPPPPIATSVLMYRDAEDRGGAIQLSPYYETGGQPDASSTHLLTSTVLFDRTAAAPKDPRAGCKVSYEDDSAWLSLQRRERSMQKDIQTLLDIQSAGLLAGLGRGNAGPGYELASDNSGSVSRVNTPTAESVRTASTTRSARLPADRATAAGAVIPVRQPRPKKLGLRGARSGLARSIRQLASLKVEEESTLAVALTTRKRALTQLRKLASRRENIVNELHSLEADDEEPLTRELITLNSAHTETSKQIAELEKQLAMLRSRKRTLEGRIADAHSQREAGLSGYLGALREVEEQLSAVLSRPSVQPLDVEALGGARAERSPGGEDKDDSSPGGGDGPALSPGGVEFLRLRPERRTTEMARSWWETEVDILERRKHKVDAERAALEEGSEVWEAVVHLVSDFESGLRKQMSEEDSGDADDNVKGKGKGKTPALTPEEKMQAQLGRMAEIVIELRGHLRTAEDKGWNLLICAIGAELEAFQEARQMLCDALRAAGILVDDEGFEDPRSSSIRDQGNNEEEDSSSTPRLAQSVVAKTVSKPAEDMLVDTGDDDSHGHGTSESEDNDVPPGLFATHGADDDEHSMNDNATRLGLGVLQDGDHLQDRDDSSENEVPLEFLSEH